ncbi:Uncharacterised protein [Mycobacteroides abscessus subsp. abscessus]|nr:Uncharacterised protein [Mycobacteroides abscessus subsp. abscessus]
MCQQASHGAAGTDMGEQYLSFVAEVDDLIREEIDGQLQPARQRAPEKPLVAEESCVLEGAQPLDRGCAGRVGDYAPVLGEQTQMVIDRRLDEVGHLVGDGEFDIG